MCTITMEFTTTETSTGTTRIVTTEEATRVSQRNTLHLMVTQPQHLTQPQQRHVLINNDLDIPLVQY